MKASRIESGKVYEVTVGKNKTAMKIVKVERRVNGQLAFHCRNVNTNKDAVIVDEKRFLKESKTGKPATPKETMTKCDKSEKPMSGLDAAYKVLVEGGRPMKVKEIAEIALANGYCRLQGATPEFTISAAMQREIVQKGVDSRFVKATRGLFAAR